MKPNFLKHDLGLTLMALYILFMGPLVIAILLIAHSTQTRLEENIKAADFALARSIAQATDLSMRNAMKTTRGLKSYAAVMESDVDEMEILFSTVMHSRPETDLVYRLDEGGLMQFHYPVGPPTTVGADFSSRFFFQRSLMTTRPLMSKGHISPTTGHPVATAAMPLWDQYAHFLGVVALDIELEAFSQNLVRISREYSPEEGFGVTIIDSGNQVVAHPDPDQLLTQIPQNLSATIEPVLLGIADTVISKDQNGIERLYSYVPISSAGWGVIVSRPTAKAFATPRTFFRGAMVTSVLFVSIGIFFWLRLTQLVIRPVGLMTKYSQAIGQKEAETPEQKDSVTKVAKRSDQMGRLARSLLRMEEAIQARLEEQSTLLQTSASVVSTLDHETVLNRILEQVENLLDVKMSAIIALNEQKGFFYAQASRGLPQDYVDEIVIDAGEPYSVTTQAIHSGEPFQISDIEKRSDFERLRSRARIAGYRSILAIPLTTLYAPPSALLIFHPEPRRFSEQELNLLSSFANHATMAIENAALYSRSDMRLQEQTRRLEALIQSINDGIILEGPDGHIIYANRRISELTGLNHRQITGAALESIFDRLIAMTPEPHKEAEKIYPVLEQDDEKSIEISLDFQGQAIQLRLHTFKVTDAKGVTIGKGQLLQDITAYHELDRMKSNLIATVSHELRTPLASIKGYATTLLADDVEWDPQSQQEFLQIISDESSQLSKLVSDLLDLSRIEAGSLQVKRQICYLEELIDNAILRATPNPSKQKIHVDLPDDPGPIHVDPRRMEVVLRNLIENASKYAGDESSIFVSASFEADNVIIKVEDTGPGIPESERNNIFNSFYQIDNKATIDHSVSGSGLGLTICQGFVQAHGGDIWLEPKERGACFVVSLPYQPKEDVPK
jgi:PAS domain S-box-containing protein